jgi:hypothetical protein
MRQAAREEVRRLTPRSLDLNSRPSRRRWNRDITGSPTSQNPPAARPSSDGLRPTPLPRVGETAGGTRPHSPPDARWRRMTVPWNLPGRGTHYPQGGPSAESAGPAHHHPQDDSAVKVQGWAGLTGDRRPMLARKMPGTGPRPSGRAGGRGPGPDTRRMPGVQPATGAPGTLRPGPYLGTSRSLTVAGASGSPTYYACPRPAASRQAAMPTPSAVPSRPAPARGPSKRARAGSGAGMAGRLPKPPQCGHPPAAQPPASAARPPGGGTVPRSGPYPLPAPHDLCLWQWRPPTGHGISGARGTVPTGVPRSPPTKDAPHEPLSRPSTALFLPPPARLQHPVVNNAIDDLAARGQ